MGTTNNANSTSPWLQYEGFIVLGIRPLNFLNFI